MIRSLIKKKKPRRSRKRGQTTKGARQLQKLKRAQERKAQRAQVANSQKREIGRQRKKEESI